MENNKQLSASFYPETLKFAQQILHIKQAHPSPMPRMVLGLSLEKDQISYNHDERFTA